MIQVINNLVCFQYYFNSMKMRYGMKFIIEKNSQTL